MRPDFTGTTRGQSSFRTEPIRPLLHPFLNFATGPIELVERAGPSREELTRRLEGALPRLQELGGGLVGAEVDERTGEIVLFYQGGAQAAVDPAAQRRAQEQARGLLQVPLRIETVETPVGDHHTRGGADLSTCTSGYVVRHPVGGTTGYITAGHCPNNQTYFEFGGVNYSTTFVGEIQDADQDVQWHTTPHIEEPRFYADSTTSHRPLNSQLTRSAQSVGGYVCHRGKTTGYSCGTIETKTFAPTYANACPGTTCSPVWVRVSGPSLKCFSGDSGGPWFLVYTAYGINKGGASSGTDAAGCDWAFYMASNYFGIDLVYD
jgi:streptogrisin C